MSVPPFQTFIEPLLRVLSESPEGLRASLAHEAVAYRLQLTESDKAELLPSGQQPLYKNRNGWAHDRLKRAGLSESATFGTWRLTAEGLVFAKAHPAPLSEEDLARITDIAEGDQPVVWRDRLAAFRADPIWVAERDTVAAKRTEVRPEIVDLLNRYFAGSIDLEAFRATYDRKTRREWTVFGAKGPSGAMVLNQLAKGAPDRQEADTALKALIREPTDESSATNAFNGFMSYLDAARERAGSAVRLPHGKRIRFFASTLWHAQAPDEWPPYFQTARQALAADGLYAPDFTDLAADYLAFRKAFIDLRKALDVSTWELETLLRWTQRDDAAAATVKVGGGDSEDDTSEQVWLIALGRNADQWEPCYRDGVIAIGWNGLGDLRQYPTLEAIREEIREDREDAVDPMNAGLACWQFVRDMQVGDTVYVKRGRHLIIGHGVIASDYRFEPERALSHVRSVEWQGRGEWKPREKALAMKTLTEIGRYPGLIRDIRSAIAVDDAETEAPESAKKAPTIQEYKLEDAEKDLFLPRDQIQELVELSRYKKNVILQGPPGVGKTFAATRLAHLLIGAANEDQIQRVQFHPSYSYEDFVQGLRPAEGGGFVRKDGPLLTFCKDALEDQAAPYVLIIDEINRGNVSKILGELLSLLEADKRDR